MRLGIAASRQGNVVAHALDSLQGIIQAGRNDPAIVEAQMNFDVKGFLAGRAQKFPSPSLLCCTELLRVPATGFSIHSAGVVISGVSGGT